MDAIVPLLTPALLVALFAWLRRDLGDMRRELNGRMDRSEKRIGDRIDQVEKQVGDLARDMNERFDQVNRELADQRERMAKLEGSLEGFLAGRRDRDVA